MKKIILFGIGDIGKKAIEFWGNDNVAYFVDNNKDKIGKTYCGKPVISVNELSEIWKDYNLIITASCYGEIVEQLKEIGISNFSKFMLPNIRSVEAYFEKIDWNKYSSVVLYGVDEYTNTLIKKMPDKIRNKIKFILVKEIKADDLRVEGYNVYKLDEVQQDYSAVLITSPQYHIADENYLYKVLDEKIEILNPYKMVSYYSAEKIIINKYENESNEVHSEMEINVKNLHRTDYFKAVRRYVDEVVDETPLFKLVEIETINRCNGICEFCPVNVKDDPREKHIMSEKLFYDIIGQLEQMRYNGRISLFSNNEPFLDERILRFSKYMREHLPKAKIHMFTNGTLLTVDKFKELIQYLDELIIDNYTQDLHLIKPAQEIKAYCEEHPELIEKVSIVLRKPKEILTSRGGMAPNRKKQEEYPEVTCAFPFQQLIIRPTGQVSLCCNDALGKYTLGDLSEESILDVWYGEKYKKIRNLIADGRKNIEICKSCDTFSLYL